MKKSISIIIILVLSFSGLFAQISEQDRVPKEYSLEIGQRYISSSNFDNQANMGTTILIDYAWQLSGFNKKSASYISVPLGYTMLRPNSDNDVSASILSYGWTVRHEIGRDKKMIPFFGYALLLNQLRQNEFDGSIFGHQTKFALGLNFNSSTRLRYFTKFEYSLTRFPQWGFDDSYRMHSWEIKIGLRL